MKTCISVRINKFHRGVVAGVVAAEGEEDEEEDEDEEHNLSPSFIRTCLQFFHICTTSNLWTLQLVVISSWL